MLGMGGTKLLPDPAWPLPAHRELAYQIAEQFRVLGKPLGLKDCIIVGGMGTGAGGFWAWEPHSCRSSTQPHLSPSAPRHGGPGTGTLSETTRGHCHSRTPG